ncbi:uncharacterized protein LOC131639197 [Vicia villosa]|uniref:uncharacterized protein LOC131639197 n=1 Tax=Vicia villosa TaxID=3911 RepID=UPI00273B5F9D|nr:uncharacterized protein LOC131639197 [Vicia villosa]
MLMQVLHQDIAAAISIVEVFTDFVVVKLALITSSRCSTTENQPFSNPHSIHDAIPVSTIENPSFYDSTSSTSSSSSSSSSSSDEDSRRESSKSRAKYEDEHARLLHASLTHVMKLGWTEAALIAGAKDVGLSPSIVGSLSRKEAALVEVHFHLYLSF